MYDTSPSPWPIVPSTALWSPSAAWSLLQAAPGWNCAHWPLNDHLPASRAYTSKPAKCQAQWHPLWLCCQSQAHDPGWVRGWSVSSGEKGHPLPEWPAEPQSAPDHLIPLWFSQPGGGYRSHNGFSGERTEKSQKQGQKIHNKVGKSICVLYKKRLISLVCREHSQINKKEKNYTIKIDKGQPYKFH
jgi:hypothetical protein